MLNKQAFIDVEVALLCQFARRNLSRELCDAVHKYFPPNYRLQNFKMITRTGKALIKQAKSVEEAMGFVTERIVRPDIPQTLYVPPTRKKKVDENGNILKPLIGHKNQGEFFGKRL